jgi:hypothetical protein
MQKTYKSKQMQTSSSDTWTHVGSHAQTSSADTWTHVGSRAQKPFSKEQQKHAPKKYQQKNIDDIMMNSSGNINLIEKKCLAHIKTLGKEDKAKAIETIISYSLHEICDTTHEFGKLIYDELSVNSSFGSIKERDGYNLFVWAIWVRYDGTSRYIAGIPRTNLDIIAMVKALLNLNVNPFRINAKKESIIGTMNMCIENGRITPETHDMIYGIILGNDFDANFYFKCIKPFIPELFRSENTFEKSIVQWAITQPSLYQMVIDTMFMIDIDRVGLTDISRKDASIEYFLIFSKLVELIQSGVYHADIAKYFKTNPIDKTALIESIAYTYMVKIYNIYPTIYEYDVSDGYAGSKEGICFKHLETLGAFLWDITQYFNFDINMMNNFDIKVMVGYGIRGLKLKKKNMRWKNLIK